jgi:hypothetical protein
MQFSLLQMNYARGRSQGTFSESSHPSGFSVWIKYHMYTVEIRAHSCTIKLDIYSINFIVINIRFKKLMDSFFLIPMGNFSLLNLQAYDNANFE